MAEITETFKRDSEIMLTLAAREPVNTVDLAHFCQTSGDDAAGESPLSWKRVNCIRAGMASLMEETLFEISGQGPAPMKDYFHFAITKSQVIWSWWKISLRTECRSTPPGQLRESHEDFLEDRRLQNQVATVFGPHILQYSKNLCQGHYDYIVRLPNALLFNILEHLDLKDISVVSRTCRRFRELCNSEEFWEQTVKKHCDTVTPTVEALAKEVGWRTVFFTNKLQLQMQISRRKQKENQPCEDKNEPSPSSVPLE